MWGTSVSHTPAPALLYPEAVRLYEHAMTLAPTVDEARAATFNLGCAQAKLKQWPAAAAAIKSSINDYGLKLTVAVLDEDLKELKDRREWTEMLTEVKGGMSRAAKVDLRTEAKAPFRLPRLILFGGLGAGAMIGLVIISLRLIAAVKGGPGAPELQETLQNFGINSSAVAVLGFLLWRDISSKEKAISVTTREELLGILQLDLGPDRVLPLAKFRGSIRPVIVAGPRISVEKALREAEPKLTSLRNRGVSVIPLYTDDDDTPKGPALTKDLDFEARIKALKKEFSKTDTTKGFAKAAVTAAAAAGTDGALFNPALPANPDAKPGEVSFTIGGNKDSPVKDADKKWRLTPYDPAEWKEWVSQQRELAKLPPADNTATWVQIQLDGTVRSSGTGIPPWAKFLDDLPPLDDVRTTFTDGIGPSD
ncbi:MAG: hypothetical protein WDW36_008313 [Sanguina aurantia]